MPTVPRHRPLTAPLALVLIAGFACGGGCAHETPPDLRVSQITMGPRSAEAVVVYFTIDAWNENDIVLPTREASYSLAIDGREVFRGRRSPEVALRDGGTQAFRLPATVPTSGGDWPRGTLPYSLRGTLNYVEPGRLAEVFFDTGVRRPNVAFTGAGTINFDAQSGAPAADIPPGPERHRPEPPPTPRPADTPPPPPPRPVSPGAIEPAQANPPPPTPSPTQPTTPPPAPSTMTPVTTTPPPGPATPAATPPPPPPPTPPPPAPPPREGFVPGRPVPR